MILLQRIKADKVKVRILLSLLRKLLLAIQNSVLCLTQTKDYLTNTFPVITPSLYNIIVSKTRDCTFEHLEYQEEYLNPNYILW